MANSAILWQGPSQIDGSPIALIATGINGKSRNAKTGRMVQTYIIRTDISPVDAIHTGDDFAICGNCQHRGEVIRPGKDGRESQNVNRSCYVLVFQGPLNVYKSYCAGKYPDTASYGAELLAGLNVRLGTYGDPAAVPLDVWAALLAKAGRCTGYTHQWRESFCPADFARYCMASADSVQGAQEAKALGYRTFRVGSPAESIAKGQEFLCPASAEAGKKTDCATCLACGGNSSPNRASVFIPAHGVKSKIKAFEKRSQASQ